MALSIRTFSPQTRRLTLVHSRSSTVSRSRPFGDGGEAGPESFERALEKELSQGAAVQEAGGAIEPEPAELGDDDLIILGSSEAGLNADAERSDERTTRRAGSSSEVKDLSDGELVALTRIGESSAFEQLYRRHAPYALALAVRVQGHSGDVEDIVHDAFLRVHGRLSELRADGSFKPWLASIVVSLVRTRLRKRRLLAVLGLSSSEPVELDAVVNLDASPEVRAQLAQVYSVLNEVPVDQRICWALRYLEGRKLEEVAALAGCSLATAKRRIAQVQERLWQREGHDLNTNLQWGEPS